MPPQINAAPLQLWALVAGVGGHAETPVAVRHPRVLDQGQHAVPGSFGMGWVPFRLS